jgi:PST family polysaccharide transporter
MCAWGVAAAALIYPSFFIGVRWGVMGVAVAYAVANFLLIGPELAISFRLINLSISDLVRSIRGVLCGSVLMAVLVAAVRHVLLAAQLESHLVLMISVVTGVLFYGIWLWATNSDAMQEVRSLGFHMWQPGTTGERRG